MNISFGSNADLKVSFTDNRDLAEDLSPYTRAALEIKASLSATAVITRSTDATATMSIESDHVLVDGLTATEWLTLTTGTYLMDVVLYHTAKDEWHRSQRIAVKFTRGVSGALS
ncbi:MAG: hypothetical protein COA69_09415 [Robiginitomaculum sp.]|nr:MAG: hypothetical protein COA69_09415 [Robiginitomaculum sp.]